MTYDASGGDSAAHDDPEPDLLAMQSHAVDRTLAVALDRISDRLDRWQAQERREELDPEILRLYDELSGQEDAPLGWRSLRRRVLDGRLTWKDVWVDPQQDRAATDLTLAVSTLLTRQSHVAQHDPDAEVPRPERD